MLLDSNHQGGEDTLWALSGLTLLLLGAFHQTLVQKRHPETRTHLFFSVLLLLSLYTGSFPWGVCVSIHMNKPLLSNVFIISRWQKWWNKRLENLTGDERRRIRKTKEGRWWSSKKGLLNAVYQQQVCLPFCPFWRANEWVADIRDRWEQQWTESSIRSNDWFKPTRAFWIFFLDSPFP